MFDCLAIVATPVDEHEPRTLLARDPTMLLEPLDALERILEHRKQNTYVELTLDNVKARDTIARLVGLRHLRLLSVRVTPEILRPGSGPR
jgi:hypothetical protein